MDDKRLFEAAREEILALRRHNELLSAKVQVVEIFQQALAPRAVSPQGYAEDIAWRLANRVDEIEKASQAAKEK